LNAATRMISPKRIVITLFSTLSAWKKFWFMSYQERK